MGTITRSFANNITSGGTFDATDLTGTIPASNIADASVTNITDVPALVVVTTVASDPPSPDAGQIWYNTTDKALRAYIQGVGAWASGGSLNTARSSGQSAGTQTAGLFFGGITPSYTTAVESYDGSSWTTLPATMNTARQGMAGGGTQTSAIGAGGYGPGGAPAGGVRTLTESWNGTAFTEVADLGTARYRFGGLAPDNTSALVFGGNTTPGITRRAQTESWNGTSWTEVNDLNTTRYGLRGAGVPGSALAFGGVNAVPASTGETESWNGTSWTEVADLNTARLGVGAAGTSNTASLAFGGAPSDRAITESWNGTSWTEVADMATGREYPSGSGTQAAALATGGKVVSTPSALTEEWTAANVTTNLGVS